MKEKKDLRARIRREFREAAEDWWSALVESGWSEQAKHERMARLAAKALRLHLFEQGRRSAKR